MAKKFIDLNNLAPITIEKDFKNWLSDDCLARFIVEVVDHMDISSIESQYRGGGSEGYPPKILISLIFYAYTSGIFSSRKIEKATYELMPAIFIAQGLHPDHTVISKFRKRFLKDLASFFTQILLIASEMGILRLGDISLDGTKIKANASKHKALSYEYACKLEDKLKQEISTLMAKAKESDNADLKDLDIPSEIKRREDRIENIAKAKATIEARRNERYQREKQEYDNKIEARELKEKERGRKLAGKNPVAPEHKPKPSDQVNLTDEESRIMPKSGGGFAQAYNAQAAVDHASMLIVENHVSQQSNDKQELEPALEKIEKLPEGLGSVDKIATDNGYKSAANTILAAEKGIELYAPSGREQHNDKLSDLLSQEPEIPNNPTASEALSYRMATKAGKAFYALRKTKIEPTFGIIKNVMGFRCFSLKGLESVTGEWNLVCIAYNLKRLCTLSFKMS